MSVRLLIVEDDPVTQRVLSQRLEAIGCTVVGIVDNAADAVAHFRELRPDLITLDIQMPEVLGVDTMALFAVIRAEDPNCEIIVITGTAFPAYREKFIKAGVLGFFLKPLNFDKLALDLSKFFPELKSDHHLLRNA
jgi:two-component system chemotaxis response regulator CheY